MTLTEWLESKNACSDSLKWKDDRDVLTTWRECKRSDWLIWWLSKAGLDDITLRKIACVMVRKTPLADGRTVWELLTDERSRKAVEVAELFSEGKATEKELAAARAVAWAAARAVAWAARAASDAARAVAWAAARAARAAAWDAARAAATAAAWDARDATAARAAQCNLIREIVSEEQLTELMKNCGVER